MNINWTEIWKNPALWSILAAAIGKVGTAVQSGNWKSVILDLLLALGGLFLSNQATNNKVALKKAGLLK